eukprot:TRINITY_DN24206_c0_g2_i1.p1 TRINITY_DN24206_c0_g2~~TRINITY_DN24206_c0_g2_i1.p1  ORF type:complete len:613 (-),score=100.27 TRINITY_DN24206_c0_g2_i1:338-2176(-)
MSVIAETAVLGMGSLCALWRAGSSFGQRVAKGECEDRYFIEAAGEAMCSAHERGILKIYRICGSPFLGVAGLDFVLDSAEDAGSSLDLNRSPCEDSIPAWPASGRCHKLPNVVRYKTVAKGNSITIAKDQVPGFLLDNGIGLMEGSDVVDLLMSSMDKSMCLTDCRCLAQHAIGGQSYQSSLGFQSGSTLKLKPGDIVLHLHMEADFQEYLQDEAAYEDRLKCAILAALQLDPRKIPNAKRDINILEVRKGSIEAMVLIGVGVLAIAGIVLGIGAAAGYFWHRNETGKKGSTHGKSAGKPNSAGETSQHPRQPFQGQKSLQPPLQSGQGLERAQVPAQRVQGYGHRPTQVLSEPLQAPTCTHQPPSGPVDGGVVGSGLGDVTVLTEVVFPGEALQPVSAGAGGSVSALARKPVQSLQYVNHADGEWEVIVQVKDTHCYLAHTIIQTDGRMLISVIDLQIGDVVRSAAGTRLNVAWKSVHDRMLRPLVRLATAQSELTVTTDHRVLTTGTDGVYSETEAGKLKVGDIVWCGQRQQALTKVSQYNSNVQVVEVRFQPDDPVETFMVPKWGILNLGAPCPYAQRGYGPLGPQYYSDESPGSLSSSSSRRTRSAEP